MKRIKNTELLFFVSSVMQKLGMTVENAELWANMLVESSLLGIDSHGIRMLERYINFAEGGGVSARAVPTFEREGIATAVLNGNACFGHIAAEKSARIALEKARHTGTACITVINTNHIGACALYSRIISQHNMIGICSTLSRPGMAPWGGVVSMIGSNPFSFAAPVKEGPDFILDISSSVVAMGKITRAADMEETIPNGWALDSKGKPTNNPEQAMKGSLLPIGGHKGYGLALSLEILSGLLGGGCFSTEILSWIGQVEKSTNVGFTIIAIDIEKFMPLLDFTTRIKKWLTYLKDSPKREGFEEILYPGEDLGRNYLEREREGVPIEDHTKDMLKRVSEKFGMNFFKYFSFDN